MMKLAYLIFITILLIGCENTSKPNGVVYYIPLGVVFSTGEIFERDLPYLGKTCYIKYDEFQQSFLIPLSDRNMAFSNTFLSAKVTFENNETYLIDREGIVKSNDLKYGLIDERKLYAYLVAKDDNYHCYNVRVLNKTYSSHGLPWLLNYAKIIKKHYPNKQVLYYNPITKKEEEMK